MGANPAETDPGVLVASRLNISQHCTLAVLTANNTLGYFKSPTDQRKWQFPFTQHSSYCICNAMSSFGANSTIKMLKIWNIKMLKNWNKSSEGLPRWSAGAGKKNHDEARQAVEQVNQRGFAITVLGVKTSQLDRALSNWDWSQCWPCPELEVGLRPPGVPFNMNDLLTPLFKIHQWEWECTILIQQSKLFFGSWTQLSCSRLTLLHRLSGPVL